MRLEDPPHDVRCAVHEFHESQNPRECKIKTCFPDNHQIWLINDMLARKMRRVEGARWSMIKYMVIGYRQRSNAGPRARGSSPWQSKRRFPAEHCRATLETRKSLASARETRRPNWPFLVEVSQHGFPSWTLPMQSAPLQKPMGGGRSLITHTAQVAPKFGIANPLLITLATPRRATGPATPSVIEASPHSARQAAARNATLMLHCTPGQACPSRRPDPSWRHAPSPT